MADAKITEGGKASSGIFQGVAYDAENPLPLGGWLIVLGAFVGCYLVFHCIVLYQTAVPGLRLFSTVFFGSESSSDRFRPLAIYLIADCAVLLAAVIGEACLLFLFLQRKRMFPAFFHKFFLVIAMAGVALVMWLFSMTNQLDWVLVGCPLAALLLWGSYLHNSERVKGTFVRP